MASERSFMTCRPAAAGICSCRRGSMAFTAWATATVFVPGCRWTASMIARWSLRQEAVLSFWTPSKTRPSSSSRTGAPSRQATTMGRNSAARAQLPARLHGEAFSAPQSVPVGRFTLWCADGADHLVDADAPRGQRLRVQLDAHGVLLRAVDLHLRHAADHRQALGDERLRVLVERRQRQGRRGERDEEDRRVGRVDLAVRRAAPACRSAAGAAPRRWPPARPAPRRRCRGRGRTGW